jgi:hypothetical protein
MTLDEIILRLERDGSAHTTSGVSDEGELAGLEQALGQPLPATLRAFLARVGGGIFYGRHEIFGGHRVMIHDIELVPSLRSVALQLRAAASPPPAGWLPFHRADGGFHLIDAAGRVVSWPPQARHASLEAFLEQVVLAATHER